MNWKKSLLQKTEYKTASVIKSPLRYSVFGDKLVFRAICLYRISFFRPKMKIVLEEKKSNQEIVLRLNSYASYQKISHMKLGHYTAILQKCQPCSVTLFGSFFIWIASLALVDNLLKKERDEQIEFLLLKFRTCYTLLITKVEHIYNLISMSNV